MKVAIDGRGIAMRETGVGRSTRLLVQALASDMPSESSLELVRAGPIRSPVSSHPRVREISVGVAPTAHPWTEIWETLFLRSRLMKLKVNLFHAPAFRTPWLRGIPTITTIHDLAAFHYPATMPSKFRLYLKMSVRHSLRRARLVVCPSESIRRELLALEPKASARVRVLPWGCPPLPRIDPQEAALRRRNLGLPSQYFLASGGGEPRKNHRRLLRAFAQVHEAGSRVPPLVILGPPPDPHPTSASDRASGNIDRICPKPYSLSLGYLEAADLAAVYRGGVALLYPSLYEGFGLPILEAMSQGLPVLTSDRGAMREVAGDAALLVDPDSTENLASAVRKLATQTDLRHSLRERGRVRAKEFSWHRTGRLCWEHYSSCLD